MTADCRPDCNQRTSHGPMVIHTNGLDDESLFKITTAVMLVFTSDYILLFANFFILLLPNLGSG